ncbi:hypothetical protein M2263_000482 [Providencia alcalifaciens]|nr:hypothetical protein [Providencia alcalifaciens]
MTIGAKCKYITDGLVTVQEYLLWIYVGKDKKIAHSGWAKYNQMNLELLINYKVSLILVELKIYICNKVVLNVSTFLKCKGFMPNLYT